MNVLQSLFQRVVLVVETQGPFSFTYCIQHTRGGGEGGGEMDHGWMRERESSKQGIGKELD